MKVLALLFFSVIEKGNFCLWLFREMNFHGFVSLYLIEMDFDFSFFLNEKINGKWKKRWT